MRLSSRPGRRVFPASVLALAMCAFATTASAEKVGVAAAVQPDAFSSLNGGPRSLLKIGKSIFYNQRIDTTGSGLVQVLLVDGSTFTVGPGSDLVIDKFVYDPNRKSGEVAATFSKGVMRFVGGKLSKNPDGVTVKTPGGSLAIRGGIADLLMQGGKSIIAFHYGVQIKFTTNTGRVYDVWEPGYKIDLSNGSPQISKLTSADMNAIAAGLSAGNGAGGGGSDTADVNPGVGGGSQQANNLNSETSEFISDANQTQIQAQLQNQTEEQSQQNNQNNPPPPCEGEECNPPPPPCEGEECNPPPPPPCEGEECNPPPPPCEGEGCNPPPPPCEGEGCNPPPPPCKGEECNPPPPPCEGEGCNPPPPPCEGEGCNPPPPPCKGEECNPPPPPCEGEGCNPPPPPCEGKDCNPPPPPCEGEGCNPPPPPCEGEGCNPPPPPCEGKDCNPPPPPCEGEDCSSDNNEHKGKGWGVGGTPPCPNCDNRPGNQGTNQANQTNEVPSQTDAQLLESNPKPTNELTTQTFQAESTTPSVSGDTGGSNNLDTARVFSKWGIGPGGQSNVTDGLPAVSGSGAPGRLDALRTFGSGLPKELAGPIGSGLPKELSGPIGSRLPKELAGPIGTGLPKELAGPSALAGPAKNIAAPNGLGVPTSKWSGIKEFSNQDLGGAGRGILGRFGFGSER